MGGIEMKQHLTSVIAARQKSPSNFLNARWIVGVLCIILIFANPVAGSANQSASDLSAQISSSADKVTISANTITAAQMNNQVRGVTKSDAQSNGPPEDQHILVCTNDILYVYTQTGELLESYEIPYPIEPQPITEYARDIIPRSKNTIFVYNGTFDPYLSILDLNSGTWTHTTYSGWSSVNGVPYGGIGVFQKYVYLTDMFTYPDPEKGILRFNLSDGSFERYHLDHNDWNQLTIGLDHQLYAVSSNTYEIQVLDPLSMEIMHEFRFLPIYILSIAVNTQGDIFGAANDGKIYHFNNEGLLLNSVDLNLGSSLWDIDISQQGQFVVSSRRGDIVLLDENLIIQNQFSIGDFPFSVFVAFLPTQ
jgi:hypothetical protein